MTSGDTIFALSSAPPPAPRCIVRLSGPRAAEIARSKAKTDVPAAGLWTGPVTIAGLDVPAEIYAFAAPRSYTGEDLLELHLPGSPWIVRELLSELGREAETRPAGPGEFTARAYLNGRMDLTAAEGVAAAISATDARRLAAARQLLAGTLAEKVRGLADQLATLLALLEAGIDFSDEEVSFVSRDALRHGLTRLSDEIGEMLAAGARFGSLSPDPSIVIVGRPNAGKSTLVNALLGRERSVVSPAAGTTRDVLWSDLSLPRGNARIADVAGVTTRDDIAFADETNRLALAAAAGADVLVLARDATDADASPHWLPRPPDLTVRTKADLGTPARSGLGVSAKTGTGLSEFRRELDALCFGRESGDGLALTARHAACLASALARLRAAAAAAALGRGDEILAAEMRAALDDLGAVTGQISPDDVLGRVFSTFCIGK